VDLCGSTAASDTTIVSIKEKLSPITGIVTRLSTGAIKQRILPPNAQRRKERTKSCLALRLATLAGKTF
jgi:hypothetical protein